MTNEYPEIANEYPEITNAYPEITNEYPEIELDDCFDYGEDRWFGIGFLGNGVAVVVWTERKNNVIRIISARRANRYERQKLEKYLSY
ncbi:BrnT family toxin [Nostoc edaphicum CCNP1411]|uniref:BrnT family toxin n=1 Tax=Nostoc edaphicum CCNP1411 TaxID=1472755 RepID=A0A7D7QKS4_9NOSO|nr:BrnT family toxin [Nostoc edaphicum CCNP1411]